MKKLLALLLSLAMLASFCVTASASESTVSFDFCVDGVEYTVTFPDCDLPYDQMEAIAKATLGIEEIPAVCSSDCSTLGHDFKEHDQYVTTHKVRASDPRCNLELFGIITCSRCSYLDLYLKQTYFLTCCAPD